MLSLLVSCGGDEPIDPTPVTPVTPVNPPTPEKDTTAPTITVSKSTINVISGPSITVSGNELKIGNELVASWKDDKSASCTVALSFAADGTSKTINSGDQLSEEGKLQVRVTDEAGNSSTSEITLTAIAVYGLENLQGKTFQVDQEVNLLEGLTFAEGLTLQKVEIEQDGQRSEIANPKAFSPQIPGTIGIVFTLARTDGSTIEVKVENLSVQGIHYLSLSITDLTPADIVPIIGQVNYGDRNVYSYIEHLRAVEAVRVVDMMWEYGVGTHPKAEYQNLLGKLNVGMTFEYPLVYDNYEIIEGVM